MSHHLIEEVVSDTTASESQSLETQIQCPKACRMIMLYEDQDSKNRAAQLCFNLRRLFSHDIVFQEAWWKLSVLQQPSMLRLAVEDAIESDVILFSFGCSNEVTPELTALNKAWAESRAPREGLLALQLQNNSGEPAEILREYFRKISRNTGLDYLTTETPEDDVPSSVELVPVTQHVLARFQAELAHA